MKYFKIMFIGIFYIISLIFLIKTSTSNNTVSNVEKRNLATYPKFTFDALLNDSYYNELTNAFNDQLYLRNDLVKGYFLFQFQRYLGDVVVGKDNEMFSAVQNNKNLEKYKNDLTYDAKLINDLASDLSKNNCKFIFLSIPRKDAVMKEYLPKTYTSSDKIYNFGINVLKENLNNDVILIDALPIFTKNNTYHYYFKNDHHINIRGGDILLKEIINSINDDNIKHYPLDETYNIKKTAINGSFNKQIGQSIKPSIEELSITPKKPISYERFENDKKSELKVYGGGTSYESAFMEGDKAFTRIETHREDLPNIMFVGSSFTNVLETLSVMSFNKLVSIDYRHNKSGMSISDYVKKYDIDYVVFVPAQSTDGLSTHHIFVHLGI